MVNSFATLSYAILALSLTSTLALPTQYSNDISTRDYDEFAVRSYDDAAFLEARYDDYDYLQERDEDDLLEARSFFSKIGHGLKKAAKGVGHAFGKVEKGAEKVVNSPIGQEAAQIGLQAASKGAIPVRREEGADLDARSFFSKIGHGLKKAAKAVGHAFGKVEKGAEKVVNSPIGQEAAQIGLQAASKGAIPVRRDEGADLDARSFFSKIGHGLKKAAKAVGHAFGKVEKGAEKVVNSPIGQEAAQIGLQAASKGAIPVRREEVDIDARFYDEELDARFFDEDDILEARFFDEDDILEERSEFSYEIEDLD